MTRDRAAAFAQLGTEGADGATARGYLREESD